MVQVVALHQPGPEEDSPDVHVVRDVGACQVANRHAEISVQDLDRHGGLLLSDAGEAS